MSGLQDKKYRILQISSGDLWAGAEAVFYELCRGLSQIKDIDVRVVILNHGKLSETCRSAGIKTYVIDETKNGFTAVATEFIRFARGFQPHIIHSHRYKENILSAIAMPFCGFPGLVTTVHGISEVNKNMKTGMIVSINNALSKYLFKVVITVSDELKKHLIKTGIPPKKLKRIYNGIELPDPACRNKHSGEGFVVGSAGRLVKVKDFRLMLDTAAIILQNFPSARFIIAGDGPEKDNLVKKINELGIAGSVEMPGHIDNLKSLYGLLDIYMNTSENEGIPMTILEAMSHGIPVVAPAAGGIPEIITTGGEGILVKERTAACFAASLIELMESPGKMASIGQAALKRIEACFSSRAMASRYYNLYSEILNQEG
jgi:L-malate glycosyltransferase